MKDLIEKLDAIEAGIEITEEVAKVIESAVYESLGVVEINENTTDQQIDEAVAKMFSNWKN